MAGWLDRLFRRSRTDVVRYTPSEYFQWRLDAIENGYGAFSYGRYGETHEEIDPSYAAYARQVYQSNPVVFASVQARISLFSEARFTWQRLSNGRPGDLFGSRELAVLETPWPNAITGTLLAQMEQDVSLCGNSYIVREGDRLRWRRPDWMSIVLSAPPDVATTADVVGYLYTVGGYDSGGETTVYTVDEVVHWAPIPDPLSLYRGMSWLQPIISDVQADTAATRHKLAWWRNSATPNLAISPKINLTPEQFKDFMAVTKTSHEGASNAGKTLFLGFGADVQVVGADMHQMDFKTVMGHGESRICAAARVPAIVVGVSEGLQAATYSNYAQARRAFGDHWARPQWRSVCGALETILDKPPGGPVRLWFDDRDVSFLREDQKDAADIQHVKASAIRLLVDAGYVPESVVAAVDADDRSLLVHSGLYSVQLQPAGSSQQEPDQTPPIDPEGA